uniref:Tetratricopeptide repeat protein 7A n=1 Tax=Lepisosteus oculatus TaxID=7918 RepID=W5NHN8_LEPOC|nr:PREDICTED: tetratricopeptide repeat protein 7A isoform X1 [Lepisosteus oculatus]
MAARISFSQYRLEAEIERCRGECQWDKIPGLVEQLISARIHEDDDYGNLLLAEALLEECLLENTSQLESSTALEETNQPKLRKAKELLSSILNRGKLQPRYLTEALLLLAKLYYVQGCYRDAQGMCDRVGFEDMAMEEQPLYHIRLLAEAFVIKGLSLERQEVSAASRVRLSEREEESLSCYLKACSSELLYLQELDKTLSTSHSKSVKNNVPSMEFELSFFQQAALQSAYLSMLRKGNVAQGVQQLRQVLRAVDTRGSQSFRKAAARKLAGALLSMVSEDSYWSPLTPLPPDWLDRERIVSLRDSCHYPLRAPHQYSGDSLFCPQDTVEEAVLLLLISESMANRDAVISRAPEQQEARSNSLQDATSVYDLLSIAMARRGQYTMLSECLERAMKFSFNEFHLWYQLGLSLMACGKGASAVSVLRECAKMRPSDPAIPLLAAKVSIGQLHWLEEGEAFARQVLDMGEQAAEFLPRAHLAVGLCYSLQATDASLKGSQDEFNRKALESLKIAHSLDPDDPQIALYLSLQLALVRQVSAAMEPLQRALNLRNDDLHSLHLLCLLFSAQKHYQFALDTINLALSQHPDSFSLLFTKVKLEEVLLGPEVALETCQHMLRLWQNSFESTCNSEADEGSSVPELVPPSRATSALHLALPDFQDPETGSQRAPSIAASRLEQAMSEMSVPSSSQKQGPAQVWTTLEHIWLQAGELFVAQGRVKEASFCVQEAGTLYPASYNVLLLRGRLAELQGNAGEAKTLYDEALTIHPQGARILLHLGRLLLRAGRPGLGEKLLRDAVQAQSTSHEAWSSLGEALQAQGSSQAPECFLTALELEASCPIVPFTVIPRQL